MGPLVVNIGLPRTGSTSLCEAVRQMGFRALHIWHPGEKSPEVLAEFRRGEGPGIKELSRYDLVTDTPFYSLRECFERYFPQSQLICTTRPREDWVASMIRHGSAGGSFFARLNDLPGPPHRAEHTEQLCRAWDRHLAQEAIGLPVIDLSRSDEERWDLLNSLFGGNGSQHRFRTKPWPHLNGH